MTIPLQRPTLLLACVVSVAACGDSTILTGPDAEAAAERYQVRAEADSGITTPIIILDGERVDGQPTRSVLRTLEPKNIERIEVHKRCSGVSMLGPEAENGIILIYTKAFEGDPIELEVRYPELGEACRSEFRARQRARAEAAGRSGPKGGALPLVTR